MRVESRCRNSYGRFIQDYAHSTELVKALRASALAVVEGRRIIDCPDWQNPRHEVSYPGREQDKLQDSGFGPRTIRTRAHGRLNSK